MLIPQTTPNPILDRKEGGLYYPTPHIYNKNKKPSLQKKKRMI